MQAHFSFGALILSLVLLVPSGAGANSQQYVLAATSTITPTGGSAQLLTGQIEISFKGLCPVPFDLSTYAVAVPEPASGLLLALGLTALGARRRSR